MRKINIFSAFAVIVIKIIQISGDESTVFINNRIENCKATEYFDVNFFVCRECDPQLNLTPSNDGKWLNKPFFRPFPRKSVIVGVRLKIIAVSLFFSVL